MRLRAYTPPMPWEHLSDEYPRSEISSDDRARAHRATRGRDRRIPRVPLDAVELFREHGIFGLLFDEEYGGTGTGTLFALAAIEEVSKVCATSRADLAAQEPGSLALASAVTRSRRSASP